MLILIHVYIEISEWWLCTNVLMYKNADFSNVYIEINEWWLCTHVLMYKNANFNTCVYRDKWMMIMYACSDAQECWFCILFWKNKS